MAKESTFKAKSAILRRFADEDLTPSQEYRTQGQIAANEIFNAIRANTGYIDRVELAGSMGKRTAIMTGGTGDPRPDFDLVLFCNGKKPPFGELVKEFKKILVDNLDKDLLKVKGDNKWCAQVVYKGFDFDILPAPNLALSNDDVQAYQKEAAHGKISSSSNPQKTGRELSTGLAESAVNFLKTQDPLTHSLVRLAKYWVRHVPNLEHFYGQSVFIETLAVSAANATSGDHPARMYLAFRAFLRKICKQTNAVFFNYYGALDVDISPTVPGGGPTTPSSSTWIVMDPVNPTNNLAKPVARKQKLVLETAARKTLSRLGMLETSKYKVGQLLNLELELHNISN